MHYDVVYLLTNEAMPDMVKIGMTSHEDVGKRIAQLNTTGVPLPFELVFACRVPDGKMVEGALHKAFAPNRVNPNREFFRIKVEQALAVMKVLHVEEVTVEVGQEMTAETPAVEIAASDAYSKSRRPPIDFLVMQIPIGSQLIYEATNDSVVVAGGRKVSFKGEEMSLTMATRKIRGLPDNYSIQPTPFWTFNGINLSALYEKTYGDEYHLNTVGMATQA
jgi:T5orf172 domain